MAFETVGVKITLEGVAAFERGMQRVERSMIRTGRQIMTAEERSKIFNRTLNRMGIALAAAGGAAIAFLFSATRLAARVETLGVVTVTLGRNVGKTEKEIRDLEKAVKAQGITLRGTRRAIALMIQAQLDLSKATELARLAQNAAVIANINSTEAFERLVFVITSGNVRMARTLGLQVSFQQAYIQTAEALDKNVTELTQLEKVQARTNAVLATGVTIAGAYEAAMETTGKKVLSLDRHLEESKRILGEAWLPIYAEAVDFITKTLQAWENLDEIQQAATSTTIGFVAAVTALVGVGALAIPKIIALGGAFSTLATAIFGTGGIIFSSTALLGIWVVAIGAAVVAIAALVKSLTTWKKMGDAIDDAIRDQIRSLNKAEVSQKEYEKEIKRLSKVTRRAIISQDEYNKLIKKGGLFARAAEKSIVLLTEAQRNSAIAAESADRVMLGYAISLQEVSEVTEEATEETEKLSDWQSVLSDRLQVVKNLASVELTQAFEEYSNKVADLTNTIEKLEAIDKPFLKQKEALRDARGELDKLNKAWRKSTAVIIASLFEQAIAIDGLTKEEILAFAALQEKLGLVDEGYAALTEAVFVATERMDDSGNQIEETVGNLDELFLALIDPTEQAGSLADAIDRLQSKQITITTLLRTITDPEAFVSAPIPEVRQAGGFAERGKAHLIGEKGPEIFIPGRSGFIQPNAVLQAMNRISSLLRNSAPTSVAAMAPAMASSSAVNNTTNVNMDATFRQPDSPVSVRDDLLAILAMTQRT